MEDRDSEGECEWMGGEKSALTHELQKNAQNYRNWSVLLCEWFVLLRWGRSTNFLPRIFRFCARARLAGVWWWCLCLLVSYSSSHLESLSWYLKLCYQRQMNRCFDKILFIFIYTLAIILIFFSLHFCYKLVAAGIDDSVRTAIEMRR